MNKLAAKIRFFLRTMLLAGVLVGICFSSGEGIRLLPFPTSDAEFSSKKTDLLDDGRLHSYARTIRNSAAPSAVAKINNKNSNEVVEDPSAFSVNPLRGQFAAYKIYGISSQSTELHESDTLARPPLRGPPA